MSSKLKPLRAFVSSCETKKEEAKPALVPKLRFPEFRETETWHFTSLDSVCEILNNRRQPITGNERTPGPYPYYGASGIVDYVGDFIFDERLLLVGEDGAKWGAFEKTAFIAEGKYWVNNHAHVLKPFAAIDTLLENYLTMQDLSPFVTGAAPPKLTLGKLKGIPVPLPPTAAEQQKIAECLSSVDELMAAQARKVDALKTHKKGLMQQLFPRAGETQPRLRFPEFQNAGEWKVGLIGDLATTVMGNAFRSTDFVESGTQVVRIGNLYQGELQLERAPVYLSDAQAEENAKFRVQPLDLLMSMTGTVGKRDYGFVIQVPPECKPLLLNQRVMKLAPTLKCDPGFLLQLLKSDRLLDAIYSVPGGTKQANLSAQHIKDLEISYPPKSEQQRIATCLSSLDALITAETEKHEALKTHKKGLMQQLFPSPEEPIS